MGGSESKPGFESALADQYVKYGEKIVLTCDVVKTKGEITATWKKNGHTLQCVKGKHKATKESDTTFTLEIQNADEADEGNYTLTVGNTVGYASCNAMVYVELKPWREMKWGHNNDMVRELQKFRISNDNVKELRFLLYGEVGSGKSSSINTIKSIFAEHQYVNCLAAAMSDTSHTLRFEKCVISKAPFAFFDIMGLERTNNLGVHNDDIIKSIKGHVKEGYTFNPIGPLCDDNNAYYNANPSLSDQMHCLICVISADKLSLMESNLIEKIRMVRKEASKLGIPQAVFLTKLDSACQLTKRSIQNVYKSKKISEKITQCSNITTIPENCIFPIQNYHREIRMNDDTNSLMLDALTQIVHWANDYVEESLNK